MEIGMESDRDIDIGGDRDMDTEIRTEVKREKQQIKQGMGTHCGMHRKKNRDTLNRIGHRNRHWGLKATET